MDGWENNYGQLGVNDRTERSSPVQVGTDNGWLFTVNAQAETMGVKTDGTLWSWGYATQGNLGLNDRTHRSSPTQIGTDTDWSSHRDRYTMKAEYSAALKTDGRIYTWGLNGWDN